MDYYKHFDKFYYNATSFKFFKRQMKNTDLNKGLVNYIIDKENEQESQNLNNDENKENKEGKLKNKNKNDNDNQKYYKRFVPQLLFQKDIFDKVEKIRELFLKFDTDRNRTFECNEIVIMFNSNSIPITNEEVCKIFGFSTYKKHLSFLDFINFIFNIEFQENFSKHMREIKKRVSPNEVCPENFFEMLEHLCNYNRVKRDIRKLEISLDNVNSLSKEDKRIIVGSAPNFVLRKSNRNKTNPKINPLNFNTSEFNKNLEGAKISQLNLSNIDNKQKSVIILNKHLFLSKLKERENELKSKNSKSKYDFPSDYNRQRFPLVAKIFNKFIKDTNNRVKYYDDLFNSVNKVKKNRNDREKIDSSLRILSELNPEMRLNYIKYSEENKTFTDLILNKRLNLRRREEAMENKRGEDHFKHIFSLNLSTKPSSFEYNKFQNYRVIYGYSDKKTKVKLS